MTTGSREGSITGLGSREKKATGFHVGLVPLSLVLFCYAMAIALDTGPSISWCLQMVPLVSYCLALCYLLEPLDG
jgi:hypothetical protein